MKIAVFSIWRSSQGYIERTLSQLDKIIEDFPSIDFSFFFYENDSVDDTVEILRGWLKGKKGDLMTETLKTKHYKSVMDMQRMKLLAGYRNKCKNMAAGQDFDFALVFDSDVVFDSTNLQHALEFLGQNYDYVMVTPNVRQDLPDHVTDFSEDSYYDVGCLRDRYGNETLYASDCPLKRIEDRMLWRLGQPVEINAGFGGFAVIRWEPFSKVSWSADLNIEHVNFCYDLKRYGKIAILPYSKVHVVLDLPRTYFDNIKESLKKQVYEV